MTGITNDEIEAMTPVGEPDAVHAYRRLLLRLNAAEDLCRAVLRGESPLPFLNDWMDSVGEGTT